MIRASADRVRHPIAMAVAVFLSGAAALILQVTWQRVIALHSGVDLSSATTVVAVFLAGLALGSLAGGKVADRCGARGALRVLAAVNVGLAAFSWASIALLYDMYRSLAEQLDAPVLGFLFNTAVLLPPTVLFGMSMPLVARAVVSDVSDAGPAVGRFNAVNTLGAAVGAMTAGWFLLGSFGFVAVTRGVGVVQVVVAALLAWSSRRMKDAQRAPTDDVSVSASASASISTSAPHPAADETSAGPSAPGAAWSARRWYVIYAVTGGIALGFEQVFFRLVDGVMRSNTYTFAHVLTLYLALWAAGAAIGSRLVRRVTDRRQWFLWLLFSAGVGALASLAFLTRVMPHGPLATRFDTWFLSSGLGFGLGGVDTFDRFLFGLIIPVLVMAVPVMCFGAAFPFAQALVSTELATVGRSTGRLLFASLVGNVAGTIVTSFVLIEWFGTAGAYLVLSLPALAAGIVAVGLHPDPGRRLELRRRTGVVIVALLLVAPSNQKLWSVVYGTTEDQLLMAEDRSCASAIRLSGTNSGSLVINGRAQNGHPFENFQILVGLVPALVHDDAEKAVAIGFGIGSTSYALGQSERVDSVLSVELCGGNYELVDELAAQGNAELIRLTDDRRHRRLVGDGRKHLLVTDDIYDLIVPDTLIPVSAGSNNVYSVEFFDLISSRLADDGMLSIYSATPRVVSSATAVFPYVVRVGTRTDSIPKFLLASRSPIELDRDQLLERFDQLSTTAFPDPQRTTLRTAIADLDVECFNDGRTVPPSDSVFENRDLRPRDEYFLNAPGMGDEAVSRSCDGRR